MWDLLPPETIHKNKKNLKLTESNPKKKRKIYQPTENKTQKALLERYQNSKMKNESSVINIIQSPDPKSTNEQFGLLNRKFLPQGYSMFSESLIHRTKDSKSSEHVLPSTSIISEKKHIESDYLHSSQAPSSTTIRFKRSLESNKNTSSSEQEKKKKKVMRSYLLLTKKRMLVNRQGFESYFEGVNRYKPADPVCKVKELERKLKRERRDSWNNLTTIEEKFSEEVAACV